MSTALVGTLRQQLAAAGQAWRALRSAAAQPSEIWATSLTYRQQNKVLEVAFNTGERFSYSAEYLRVESPAAGNQDARDARGRLKVVSGRREVGILNVEPVGSYAVRLEFDDLHTSGIYSWPYLHELGTSKLSRMRRYLRLLRERGLSRDPPRSRLRARQAQQQQQEQQQQQQAQHQQPPPQDGAT